MLLWHDSKNGLRPPTGHQVGQFSKMISQFFPQNKGNRVLRDGKCSTLRSVEMAFSNGLKNARRNHLYGDGFQIYPHSIIQKRCVDIETRK